MVPLPDTRPSLLVRLGNPHDSVAWRQFAQIYAPLVYGLARRRGLQDADAADITQDVCRTVAGSIHKLRYDPRNGTFRGWLLTITRHRLTDFWRQRQREPKFASAAALDEVTTTDQTEGDEWERDYQRQVFATAAAQVRDRIEPATWEAFWRTAVEGHAPTDVARALNMNVGSIYVAKSRVMSRIKQAAEEFQ